MKKNGFITSALLYGMLALFIVLMLSCLAILANRKISMDNLKSAALKNAQADVIELSASEELTSKSEEEKIADGLVEDAPEIDEEGNEKISYLYHGANPKNYIKFNSELWRIMKINSDGTMKIIRNDLVEAGVAYDTGGSRTSDYCYNTVQGCNIWGSNTNTYDRNLTAITAIPLKFGGTTTYALPDQDATMNIYLNTTYYNGLKAEAKEFIPEAGGIFNVGSIVYDSSKNQGLDEDVEQVSSVKWRGKVGIIDVTEYVKASDDPNCLSFNNGGFYDENGAACRNGNYLYIAPSSGETTGKFWQTLTPQSGSPYYVYSLRGGENGNDGYLAAVQARLGNSIRPVVYLREDIKIVSGDGSKENPYEIEIA